MSTYDPPTGFYFMVAFELFSASPEEFQFQEVSGLHAEVEIGAYSKGSNTWMASPPAVRDKYEDITLRRGMLMGEGIIGWCLDAMENVDSLPTNLTVSLMNEHHVPLQSWYVVNAIPRKFEISDFETDNNSILVESLVLEFEYCKTLQI